MKKFGKKALLGKILFWILNLIIVGSSLTIVVGTVHFVFKKHLDTHNLEYQLMIDRAIKCLSYKDNDIDRTYIGIVDLSKFNKENVDSCLKDPNNFRKAGLKIVLKYSKKDTKEFFFNKEFYEDYEPLTWSVKYNFLRRNELVLVKTNQGLDKALLEIKAVFRVGE